MDSTIINTVLKRNCPIYGGIYASNNLPDISTARRPLVIVVNTDPSNRPGRHWICMYFNEGRCEYFDSFGLRPTRSFERYMYDNCISWTFNRNQIQSIISRFCGHYCVWYCIMKSRDVTLNELLSAMSNDTGLNDYLVHRFVCKLI